MLCEAINGAQATADGVRPLATYHAPRWIAHASMLGGIDRLHARSRKSGLSRSLAFR